MKKGPESIFDMGAIERIPIGLRDSISVAQHQKSSIFNSLFQRRLHNLMRKHGHEHHNHHKHYYERRRQTRYHAISSGRDSGQGAKLGRRLD